jgi:hypothetical protein
VVAEYRIASERSHDPRAARIYRYRIVKKAAAMPREGTRGQSDYGRLMRSLVVLADQEPELRRRAVFTALGMAASACCGRA